MKELASLADVPAMTISYYENGDQKPSMDTMKALAEALGVRITDFLSNGNENLVFVHGSLGKAVSFPLNNRNI